MRFHFMRFQALSAFSFMSIVWTFVDMMSRTFISKISPFTESGPNRGRRHEPLESRRGREGAGRAVVRAGELLLASPEGERVPRPERGDGQEDPRKPGGAQPEEGDEAVRERADRVAAAIDERVDEALGRVLLLARDDREENLAGGLHESEFGGAAQDLEDEERPGRGRSAEREEAGGREDGQERESGPEADRRE